MSGDGERFYDPVFGTILTRLKKTAQQVQQECEEKARCIRYAEELLRQASVNHP
jgi:dihydroxyacetone kinase-like predicted kinase